MESCKTKQSEFISRLSWFNRKTQNFVFSFSLNFRTRRMKIKRFFNGVLRLRTKLKADAQSGLQQIKMLNR